MMLSKCYQGTKYFHILLRLKLLVMQLSVVHHETFHATFRLSLNSDIDRSSLVNLSDQILFYSILFWSDLIFLNKNNIIDNDFF
jgi:hypothetical protein